MNDHQMPGIDHHKMECFTTQVIGIKKIRTVITAEARFTTPGFPFAIITRFDDDYHAIPFRSKEAAEKALGIIHCMIEQYPAIPLPVIFNEFKTAWRNERKRHKFAQRLEKKMRRLERKDLRRGVLAWARDLVKSVRQ